MAELNISPFTCPAPLRTYPRVLLAHGGGGNLMHQLIDQIFMPAFDNPLLHDQLDSALLRVSKSRLAFTTDSYVVRPLFFPGGDIGRLAVNGTVNDLAMAGAHPVYLSAGFILEEGFEMEALWRIVQSMKSASQQAGVHIVTGDTKVVEKGKGDGIFINTSGIGLIEHDLNIAPKSIQEGDVFIVNGDLGRHGMAIMALRDGLQFESAIESDSAPLADLILSLINAGIDIHCLRDLTRGGLASALNEVAMASQRTLKIEELLIPVRQDVASACEMFGLDPLYVANEGRCVAFLPAPQAKAALQIMRRHPLGREAALIGEVTAQKEAIVTMKSKIGASRLVDMLSGEQLPRIC